MGRLQTSCGLLVAIAGCNAVFGIDETRLPPDAPVICPQSYRLSATGTYRVQTAMQPFVDAELACENDAAGTPAHTHLAVAATTGELNVLYGLVQAESPGSRAWIGLNDGASPPAICPNAGPIRGYWWITDELAAPIAQLDVPWGPQEPGDVCADHCVHVSGTSASLADDPCTLQIPSICECDDYAADPTHYAP